MDPRKNPKITIEPRRLCAVCNSDSFKGEYGSHDICPVCRWQDDYAFIYNEPDESTGANRVTLNQAIANYQKYRVSETRFVKDQSIVEPRLCPVCDSPSFRGDHCSGDICLICKWIDETKFDSPDEV